MAVCYCGNMASFESCCEPFIIGVQKARSAEQLMRSRYSAYCTQAANYLVQTTHKSTRQFHKKSDILEWSVSNKWMRLEIIKSAEFIVEFKAFFTDENNESSLHHEKSTFTFDGGKWFYVDGIFF